MKIYRALLLSFLVLANSAFANTFMSDYSDLWWNANESGWGVTVSHQREVIFLAFFVYGTDGKPTWLVGQGAYSIKNAQGQQVFTGSMYQTSGPWFGTTFNPNSVTNRLVGSLTFSAFLDGATLTYSIDGVSVTKALTRQTYRNNDLTGEYMGAIKSIQTGCRAPYTNGNFNSAVTVSVTNFSTTFFMTMRKPDGSSCTYSGSYTQGGRLGSSYGSYSCTTGAFGNYDAFEIEANISGFIGRYTASDNFCSSVSGRFAAMKQ